MGKRFPLFFVWEDYISPLDVILKKEEIDSHEIIPLREKLKGMNVALVECPFISGRRLMR
ncbi:MAG: hypothetical protein ACLTZT_19250 [Butyricimonas faecalis]